MSFYGTDPAWNRGDVVGGLGILLGTVSPVWSCEEFVDLSKNEVGPAEEEDDEEDRIEKFLIFRLIRRVSLQVRNWWCFYFVYIKLKGERFHTNQIWSLFYDDSPSDCVHTISFMV